MHEGPPSLIMSALNTATCRALTLCEIVDLNMHVRVSLFVMNLFVQSQHVSVSDKHMQSCGISDLQYHRKGEYPCLKYYGHFCVTVVTSISDS